MLIALKAGLSVLISGGIVVGLYACNETKKLKSIKDLKTLTDCKVM